MTHIDDLVNCKIDYDLIGNLAEESGMPVNGTVGKVRRLLEGLGISTYREFLSFYERQMKSLITYRRGRKKISQEEATNPTDYVNFSWSPVMALNGYKNLGDKTAKLFIRHIQSLGINLSTFTDYLAR